MYASRHAVMFLLHGHRYIYEPTMQEGIILVAPVADGWIFIADDGDEFYIPDQETGDLMPALMYPGLDYRLYTRLVTA